MPTVAELKDEAKKQGLKGYSRMVKSQLEEALGYEVVSKPKAEVKTSIGAKKAAGVKPAPRAKEVTSLVRVYTEKDVIVLTEILAEGDPIIHVIPAQRIGELSELKKEIALPFLDRLPVDDESDQTHIDMLIVDEVRRLEGAEAAGGYAAQDGENIIYSAAVLMF